MSEPSQPVMNYDGSAEAATQTPAKEEENPMSPPETQADPLPSLPETQHTPVPAEYDWRPGQTKFFVTHLLGAGAMLIWPWIFFAVAWTKGGIEMAQLAARRVEERPHDTTFILTTISNKISHIVGYFFSVAVLCFARNQIMSGRTEVFHISFFAALKHHNYISIISKAVFRERRWMFVVVAAVYFELFDTANSGINTLLTPIDFTRTAPLSGTELNFASQDPACLTWFANYDTFGFCNWTPYKGANFTTCLSENQLVDVLEAGRGSILSLLPNRSTPLTLTQLGGVGDGIQIIGSLRGVLPNGPNGVPALDSIATFPISPLKEQPNHFYNYTLDLQGITSDVNCSYHQVESPVTFTVTDDTVLVNGTCQGQQDILTGANFTTIYSTHFLGFWACQQSNDSYTLYLRGGGGYRTSVGNLTCSVSSAQLATFRAVYTQQSDTFDTQKYTSTPLGTNTTLITSAIMAVIDNVFEAQNPDANMLAESVITMGIKFFGLPSNSTDDGYLKLYEAMLQGMIDYEATYLRLVYSTWVTSQSTPPGTCMRTFVGSANYTTFGWNVNSHVAWELLPITVINLTSIILLLISMSVSSWKGRPSIPRFDPLQAVVINHKTHAHAKLGTPEHWPYKVILKTNKAGKYGLFGESHDRQSSQAEP